MGVEVVFQHPLGGRLGLFVGVLVLASACGGGEISDVPAGTRLGPEASGDGEMCSSGTCIDAPAIDAPATSLNWWKIVPKPDATNTGPNCSAPGCPSATLLPGNAPPSTITQDGATYENFTMTLDDCIYIQADNVTFRNFYIYTDTWRAVCMEGNSTNMLMEYGEMLGGSTCNEFIVGQGWTGRYLEMHSCDDGVKIGNNNSGVGPTTITNSYWYDYPGGHGDTITLWPSPNGEMLFQHNYFEGGNTSVFITDNLQADAVIIENWMVETNGGYGVYCDPRIEVTNNLFTRGFVAPWDEEGCTVSGNRWLDDFSPVPHP